MNAAMLEDMLEVNPQGLVGNHYIGGGCIPIHDEQFALYRGDYIVIINYNREITEVIERERLWSVTTL